MNWLEKERVRREEQNQRFAKLRKTVRENIMAKAVLYPDTPLIYKANFDGYGDSGNCHISYDYPEEVRQLLHGAVDVYVSFDWYNNDGGGGDITWDVTNDKITINGYQNVTTQEPIMEEAEF